MLTAVKPKTRKDCKYVFYDRTLCEKPWCDLSKGIKNIVFASSKAAAIKKLKRSGIVFDEKASGVMNYRRLGSTEKAIADRSLVIS